MSFHKKIDEIPGLPLPKKVCPCCGCQRFHVTAHVTQGWIVDGDGDFEECVTQCDEVTHKPDDEDLWQCADCGYDAAGAEFNKTDFAQPRCRYVMRVYDRNAGFRQEEFRLMPPEKLVSRIERQWQSDELAAIIRFWKKHNDAYEGYFYSILDLDAPLAIIHGVWNAHDLTVLAGYQKVGSNGTVADDADNPRFTCFEEIVGTLDDWKQAYYLLQYCHEHAGDFDLDEVARQQLINLQRSFLRDQADCIIAAITSGLAEDDIVLLNMLKADTLDNLKAFQAMDYPGTLRKVGTLFEQVLAEHESVDQPFYRDYGKYWNEVPLPNTVERIFTAYVDSRKPSVPGMLGVEGPKDETLPDGTTGISYYDLSDLMILFENRTAAEAFVEENGVEPSQYLTFSAGGFHGD